MTTSAFVSGAVGAYPSSKSVKDNYNKHKAIAYWEVDHLPEMERKEVEVIYRNKGFKGELLKQVIDIITADKDRWVDVMTKDELEMSENNKYPIMMGFVINVSFILIGLIPLSFMSGTM